MPPVASVIDDDARRRLTTEVLDRLLDAREAGDSSAEHAAATALAELHLDIARSIASRYRNRGLAAEDLEQVASLAVLRAARSFDPGRGVDFLAYAVPVVRGDLRHYFRDHGWVVRPPRRVQELQGRVIRERDAGEPAGRPRAAQIAARLGADASDVTEALAAEGCFSPCRSTPAPRRTPTAAASATRSSTSAPAAARAPRPGRCSGAPCAR